MIQRFASRVTLLALVFSAAIGGYGCSLLDRLNGPSSLTIQTFQASPQTITAGAFTTLNWEVVGADSVSINNGIGSVDAKGTRTVQLLWTTAFTLSAKSGTNSAQSLAQVQVLPTGGAPGPSPSPSPSVSPSPGPSPSPSASPSPSTPQSCGDSAGPAGSCSVRITFPTGLPEGQCVQVNIVSATPNCPVGGGTNRNIAIGLTAHTSQSTLFWRGGSTSADVLTPSTGTFPGDGQTTLQLQDNVGDSVMKFEIADGQGNVLLRLTLSNL